MTTTRRSQASMSNSFPRFRRRISVRYYRNSGVRRAMKSGSSRRALAAAELITILCVVLVANFATFAWYCPYRNDRMDAAEGKVNACRFPAEAGGTGGRGAFAPVIAACQSSSWGCWVRLVSWFRGLRDPTSRSPVGLAPTDKVPWGKPGPTAAVDTGFRR